MATFTRRTEVPVPAEELFAWHTRPGAFERLTPPWQPVRLLYQEGLRDGQRAVIALGPRPLNLRWIAEHEDYREGRQFRDVQIEGPFARWEHTHRMLPHDLDRGRSVLEDRIAYELPLASVTEPLAGRRAEAELARIFAYRHRVVREDLARHAAAGLPPQTIVLTGATGLIGSALAAFLTTGGHIVVRLVRSRIHAVLLNRSAQERTAYWDPARAELELGALDGADAVIHLAGEPVLGRWTRTKRAEIFDSRVRSTRFLAECIAGMRRPPRVWLSASATGIYGDRGPMPLDEHAPPGEGFLAEVCQAWEAATAPAEAAGVRVAHLRTGVVLSPKGGMLKLALPAFRLGLGGPLGNPHSWIPWIALDDVLYAVLHLLAREDLRGPINLTAPHPVTQRAFAQTLGDVLGRPALLRVPRPVLSGLTGEMGRQTILASARVLPQRLLNSGFRFAYPHLADALRHLLGRDAEETASGAQRNPLAAEADA